MGIGKEVDTGVSTGSSSSVDESLKKFEKAIIPPVENEPEAPPKFSKPELNRTKTYEEIKKSEPVTIYGVHKLTGIPYTSVKLFVREMVFLKLVHQEVRIGENNRTYKILTVPKEVEE